MACPPLSGLPPFDVQAQLRAAPDSAAPLRAHASLHELSYIQCPALQNLAQARKRSVARYNRLRPLALHPPPPMQLIQPPATSHPQVSLRERVTDRALTVTCHLQSPPPRKLRIMMPAPPQSLCFSETQAGCPCNRCIDCNRPLRNKPSRCCTHGSCIFIKLFYAGPAPSF